MLIFKICYIIDVLSFPHNITSIDCFSSLRLNVVKIGFIVELTDRNISEVTLKINSQFCSWKQLQFASIRITTKQGIIQIIRQNKIKNEVAAHRSMLFLEVLYSAYIKSRQGSMTVFANQRESGSFAKLGKSQSRPSQLR